MPPAPEYDPRYLAGVLFFNNRQFFEAHEVWESLWMDCAGPERRFYQGLIQAAVGLYHFGNSNVRGATKLYHSSRAYMERFLPAFAGLDIAEFWRAMAFCFDELLADANPDRRVALPEDRIPTITLDPHPETWPDPEQFLREDE
jgi:predicted metal-dependent hydrolase